MVDLDIYEKSGFSDARFRSLRHLAIKDVSTRRFIPIIAALLVASGLMVTSCKKVHTPDDISDEIYHLVLELEPTSVDEYLYNSEKVYHFDTWRGPDDYTCLYSIDGQLMAYFGGFTGKGDGRCADFFETAVLLRTVYADNRWIRSK